MNLGFGIGLAKPFGDGFTLLDLVFGSAPTWLTGNLLSAPTTPNSTPTWEDNATIAQQGTTTDPNGVQAWRLTNTTTGSNLIQWNVSGLANQSYKVRVVAQLASQANLWLSCSNQSNANFNSYFNLSTGTITSHGAVGAGVWENTIMNNLGNGWYECIVEGHFTAAENMSLDLRIPNNTSNIATTIGQAVVFAEPGLYVNG